MELRIVVGLLLAFATAAAIAGGLIYVFRDAIEERRRYWRAERRRKKKKTGQQRSGEWRP